VRAASMSSQAVPGLANDQPIFLHTMGGAVTSGYMTINNHAGSSDYLIAAQSDVVGSIEMHLSQVKGDVMQMIPQDKIQVSANGQMKLEPAGYHLTIGVDRYWDACHHPENFIGCQCQLLVGAS
jgi:copper(I)-binding protein